MERLFPWIIQNGMTARQVYFVQFINGLAFGIVAAPFLALLWVVIHVG